MERRARNEGRGTVEREIVRTRTLDGAPIVLTHVRAGASGAGSAAALLVHGFGQNRYLFDFPPRSFAEFLADAGIDAYVLELRGHGLSRRRGGPWASGIVDYAELDLPAALSVVRARQPTSALLLVGHSMGGVTCLSSPPEILRDVRGVVAIAAPTHLGRRAWGTQMLGRVGAAMLRAGGSAGWARAFNTAWMARVLRKALPVMDAPLPWPVHIWHPREMERPLLDAYLRCSFEPEARGVCFDFERWMRERSLERLPGDPAFAERMQAMPVPVLFVAGRQDRLVPPASIEPGYALTRASHKSWMVFGERHHEGRYGHIDLVLGRHAPTEVWPRILDWLRAALAGTHNGAETAGERAA
jgi:predicted alpha/beta hydrolase